MVPLFSSEQWTLLETSWNYIFHHRAQHPMFGHVPRPSGWSTLAPGRSWCRTSCRPRSAHPEVNNTAVPSGSTHCNCHPKNPQKHKLLSSNQSINRSFQSDNQSRFVTCSSLGDNFFQNGAPKKPRSWSSWNSKSSIRCAQSSLHLWSKCTSEMA